MFALNQSIIKKIVKDGNLIPVCWYKLFHEDIKKDEKSPTSEAMLKGIFFETMAIGAGAQGQAVYDLPRKIVPKKIRKRNPNAIGEKRISQIRIEQQAEKFKILAEAKELIIMEGINTQVKIYKRWEKDPSIILVGTLDIGPTRFKDKSGKINIAIIDLKLTGDITTTYGPFPWGDYNNIEKIQPKQYLYLIENIDFELNDKLNPDNNLRELFTEDVRRIIDQGHTKFYFWVFDYKLKPQSKIFPPYQLDKMIRFEYHETIRKASKALREAYNAGWPANPNSGLCADCKVKSCKYKDMIEYNDNDMIDNTSLESFNF